MKALFPFLLCLVASLPAAPLVAQTDAALAAAVAEHERAAQPPLFARSAFLQEARVRTVLLAPDGNHVAWLARSGADNELHLLDTTTLQSTRILSLARLRNIEWGADGKLVLDLGDAVGVLDPAEPSAPSFIARLNQMEGEHVLGASRAANGGALLVRTLDNGLHALELVTATGKRVPLLATPEKIEAAFATSAGERAFVETVTAQERHIAIARDGSMRTLLTCPLLATCRLVSHDAATDILWLRTSHDTDLQGLQALALGAGTFRNIHADPENHVDLDTVSLRGAQPVIAAYHDGTLQNYALDASLSSHLNRLGELLPQRNLGIALSADGATWLVTARAAVLREARFYLYSPDTLSLREILTGARDDTVLPAEALSAKIPLAYTARDGKRVYGYVSLPKGLSLRDAPLVALPHGGPWAHITSDYFHLTQFLVNRGYIVFEPNFRSSTGYGLAWMEAANREFGDGVVQQDIVDGVRYLLAQGVGAPGKVGIVGGSFGGFSVLAGLALNPDLFRVGVAAVPPASLGSVMRHQLQRADSDERDPALKELMRLLLVDTDDPRDMQRLQSKSPQAHFAAITAPLLIVAGADDTTVNIAHVKQYTLELVNLRKAVTLFVDEHAGHAMESPLMWQAFFHAAEQMLAANLGGRSEPLRDPQLAAYMRRKLLLNTNTAFAIE